MKNIKILLLIIPFSLYACSASTQPKSTKENDLSKITNPEFKKYASSFSETALPFLFADTLTQVIPENVVKKYIDPEYDLASVMGTNEYYYGWRIFYSNFVVLLYGYHYEPGVMGVINHFVYAETYTYDGKKIESTEVLDNWNMRQGGELVYRESNFSITKEFLVEIKATETTETLADEEGGDFETTQVHSERKIKLHETGKFEILK